MCIAQSTDDGNIPSVERNANTNKEKNDDNSNENTNSRKCEVGMFRVRRVVVRWRIPNRPMRQERQEVRMGTVQEQRIKVGCQDMRRTDGNGVKESNLSCQQCRQPLEEWEAGICEGCGIMKIMLWTGRTARQEILATAALRMKCFGWTATNAILSCVDAWQSKPEGSICHSVGLYVDALTDREFKRLEGDVLRKAKSE
jgi:hypothetical protein